MSEQKKILIIGNGGREHAIIEALSRSPQKPILYNFGTAINPGIQNLCEEVFVGDIMDNQAIQNIAKPLNLTFAIVGPDDPIGNGAADKLKEINIPTFAPSAACAQLESSKAFTRNLLAKHNIDASPDFGVSTDITQQDQRRLFYEEYDGQIVVKADGLLGGKGVIVAGEHFTTFEEAEEFAQKSIDKFGKVVLEEKLIGEEFSLISIVDGETVLDTPAIQDHKRAFENDEGPNTGGMGCYSDENSSLPFITQSDLDEAHKITVQTMKAITKELDERFVGIMYGGFIVTKRGVKLIEYNARFGDPEALNILPILKTDFVEVCEKAISHSLSDIKKLEFEPVATVVKYLCPEGYPTNSVKNVPFTKYKSTEKNPQTGNQQIFFASVGLEDDKLILKGSRAIGILGTGKNIEQALKNCESLITEFEGPVFFRKDIGTKNLIQKRIDHMTHIRSQQ